MWNKAYAILTKVPYKNKNLKMHIVAVLYKSNQVRLIEVQAGENNYWTLKLTICVHKAMLMIVALIFHELQLTFVNCNMESLFKSSKKLYATLYRVVHHLIVIMDWNLVLNISKLNEFASIYVTCVKPLSATVTVSST